MQTYSDNSDNTPLQPEAEEIILCDDSAYVCETYLFEPSPGEESFGFLFIAGEVGNKGGIGRELLDTVAAAIQKEYYRDLHRSATNSFEMALHQANLILHDTAEQGVRDWMSHFHVAVGVLVQSELHVSVAGAAQILLSRKSHLSEVSADLSHYPITTPLKTFSQVATGQTASQDMLIFATSQFSSQFQSVDIARLALDHSSGAISSRLQSAYKSSSHRSPIAAVLVSLLPQYVSSSITGKKKVKTAATTGFLPEKQHKANSIHSENIRPREPLHVQKSKLRKAFLFIAQISVVTWTTIRQTIWPAVKSGSQKSGQAILQASKSIRSNSMDEGSEAKPKTSFFKKMAKVPARSWGALLILSVLSAPKQLRTLFRRLPTSSKIFGIISLILALSLITSVVLLQRKRANDADIQRASELLHSARTKKEAAETALIYNNREQAKGLLEEAQAITAELVEGDLYIDETTSLQHEITSQTDRLQRIARFSQEEVREVADIGNFITGKKPSGIFSLDGTLFTYNPDNNFIIKINLDGTTEVVRQTTQGTGFITGGVAHPSDRTIIFSGNPSSVAIFDSKDNSMVNQTIEFENNDAYIGDLEIFGNRLYVYDSNAKDLLVFNKTLRGYGSGSPWITDASFPKDTIRSIAIDGNVFTLHDDGSIRRLFRGAPADFVQEHVEPSLASATQLITSESFRHVYAIDPTHNRVVAFTKTGLLARQILVPITNSFSSAAIDPKETMLYVLDGTKVLEIPLKED